MARLAVLCLLATVCCAAVGAAADNKLMVSDVLVSSKSTKARTSSYYDDTELACMAQLNFKNCRYTGCPVDTSFVSTRNEDLCSDINAANRVQCEQCAPDSIYFQTDFSCCPKEHHYPYGDGDHIGLAFDDKVGTCDWEISMYRSGALGTSEPGVGNGVEVDPWDPHPTDDGTALKWGTAWGTCYLNGEAEHCDHPLCERMAINIQGGLYATCAYATDIATLTAQSEGTCTGGGNATLPGINFNDFNFPEILTYLQTQSSAQLATACFGTTAGRRLQSYNSAQDYGSHTETYYPGVALVLSGPMTVTAKKDHRFEETGMFQQTISFARQTGDLTTTELTNRWPIVAPRGTKARFTRRAEGYYQGGSQ